MSGRFPTGEPNLHLDIKTAKDMAGMTADVQRELVAPFAAAVGCVNGCPDCAKTIAALLPTVQALIADAEKRAAAAELRAAADDWRTAELTGSWQQYLRARADALDPT